MFIVKQNFSFCKVKNLSFPLGKRICVRRGKYNQHVDNTPSWKVKQKSGLRAERVRRNTVSCTSLCERGANPRRDRNLRFRGEGFYTNFTLYLFSTSDFKSDRKAKTLFASPFLIVEIEPIYSLITFTPTWWTSIPFLVI